MKQGGRKDSRKMSGNIHKIMYREKCSISVCNAEIHMHCNVTLVRPSEHQTALNAQFTVVVWGTGYKAPLRSLMWSLLSLCVT